MPLDQTNMIDAFDRPSSNDNAQLILYAIDLGDVKDPAHRYQLLVKKLKYYVQEIQGATFQDEFGPIKPSDVLIQVVCKTRPTEKMAKIKKLRVKTVPEQFISVEFQPYKKYEARLKQNEQNAPASDEPVVAFADIYHEGLRLQQMGEFDEAIATFELCFAWCREYDRPLMIEDYCNVVLSHAFCLANQYKWDEALAIYHQLEEVVKQEGAWMNALVQGVKIGVPKNYNARLSLATLYESIALAYHYSDRFDQAGYYYDFAIEAYSDYELWDRAESCWFTCGVAAQNMSQWQLLATVGESLYSLSQQTKHINMQIEALRFLSQSAVNVQDLRQAADYLKHAISLEREIGDPRLANDMQMYQSLNDHLNQH